MKNQHEKSSCCQSTVVRFGSRRRQCTACGHTWRVWQRRRGRKRKRSSAEYAIRYLAHDVPPVRAWARARGLARTTAQWRLARSRDQFLTSTSWPIVPAGPLIAIADAWVKYIEGSWHTWYLILLRPVQGTQATITPLVRQAGRETVVGWRAAFDRCAPEVLARIVALVCDGHRGLTEEAHWRGWLLQRCHFHLIAAIQGRRSRWGASRHRAEGERLFRLATTVLTARDTLPVQTAVNELEVVSWQTRSRTLKHVLRGFVNHAESYRTFLAHPELNLPRTSNTAEVFFSRVEDLCHRARGFATVQALDRWIEAVAKYQKTITCNGARQPN